MKTRSLLLFLCLLAAAIVGFGQITSQSGAITGTVLDPAGAVVPGAKVTVSSAERGITSTVTSNSTGDFTFPLLTPGTYRVAVEATGFSRSVVNTVRVQVTETTRVPVTLEVGALTTEVTVAAEAVSINTTNSSVGNTLPGSEIENLPLATRNFTNLLALNAGTSSALPDASAVGRGSATVFVNGQRGTANNLVINGIDANNIASNNFGNVPIPSPDSIEEFRVQTNLYDASQGRTSGGNINALTRGGTSEYHGQLYEFFRNEKLNANDFFFNKTGQRRPVLRQNQFGGNFGGPVPGMGKKTFFFGSYMGTRQINGLSGAINAAFPVLPAQRTRANLEQAFSLAGGALDPVALRLLNAPGNYNGFFIPSGAGAPGTFGQLSVAAPTYFKDNQFNANADHMLTDSNRLQLRYFSAPVVETKDPLGGQGAGGLGSGQTTPIRNHLASISDVWTINPRLVNEARFGFNRIQQTVLAQEPVSLADVGMTRFNQSLYSGVPLLITNDLGPVFGGISTNNDQASVVNTFHLADTLAYIQGRHNFRFGFEARQYQINTYNNFASRGFLLFNTFNDFLTGNILQSFAGSGQTYRDFRAEDVSLYAQDDWKVTNRLTLNLGLRYDYLGPATDKRNRVGNFDPSLLDANTLANGGPGLRAGFVIPEAFNASGITGTPGVSRSTLTESNKTNFAPRVGFAYDVFGKGKTAVRGGYGMYYVRISNQTLLQLLTAAPFFQLFAVNNPGLPLSNPYPNLPLPSQFPIFPTLPALTAVNPTTGAGTFSSALLAINPIQRNLRTPYAQHYNFTIQQRISNNTTVELGYLGSQGVRLLQSIQLNQARLANPQNPIRGGAANSSANASVRTLVAGFSTTGLNAVTNNGHSTYNAFIATLNHRSGNAFLQTSYTFSKSIDNNSGSATQDLGNAGGNQLVPELQRGLSTFDRTHRLQVTYRYEIPGFRSGMLKYVLGNWNVGGLTTYQSALPVNFAQCACGSTNVYGITGTLYPNISGDLNKLQKDGNPRNFVDAGTSVYNSGILTVPTPIAAGGVIGNVNRNGGPGTETFPVGPTGSGQLFGTLPRNVNVRGPFQQQWDAFAEKRFPIKESMMFSIRGEFFNLFNHYVFAAPNAQVGGSAFGRYTAGSTAPRIIQLAAKFQF